MTSKFVIPTKIGSYIKRLSLAYKVNNQRLHNIVASSKVFVREHTDYDNLDGGMYGHDIVLFCDEMVFEGFSLSDQDRACVQLREDLRNLTSDIAQEFISSVSIQLEDESDIEFQRAMHLDTKNNTLPENVKFWTPGLVRVFISHRDNYKAQAKELSEALEEYGISAFVAHDTIEPMDIWQNEIIKGLETMEVMLCFVTDDFHESIWTNQEIGFALGRNIPIISLKLEERDPAGFIGAEQAVRGSISEPAACVKKIFNLIAQKVGYGSRMKKALLEAFFQSNDFDETKKRFIRLDASVTQLTNAEAASIVAEYNKNDQLYKCYYLIWSNRLLNFLNRSSENEYQVVKNKILELPSSKSEDSLPF